MIDFTLTEEQQMFKDMAKNFAEKECGPRAAEVDANHRFPRELFDMMTEQGFTGIGVPEEFGGSGCNDLDKAIVIEEIAKQCASTAGTLAVHLGFGNIILNYGNEAQKQKYLPEVAAGGALGAFALTEPGSGSDAASIKTKAVLDEATGEYVINGSKCFITGGAQAKYIALFCLTQPEKKLKGMSCIIVEQGTPGFEIGKKEHKMGLNGSETVELFFNDCRVPKENLVGEEGKGFKYAMATLDGGRIAIAAQSVGIAQGALDLAVKYSKERMQFGKPICDMQGIQWYLADMATRTEAARAMVMRAAALKVAGQPYTTAAAMAKYFAAENACFVTDLALQIHGGYGYMEDYPLARMYRDAKLMGIYEGTNEIHKVVISRAVLSGK